MSRRARKPSLKAPQGLQGDNTPDFIPYTPVPSSEERDAARTQIKKLARQLGIEAAKMLARAEAEAKSASHENCDLRPLF